MLYKIVLLSLKKNEAKCLTTLFLNVNAVGKNLTFLLPPSLREVTESHMKEKMEILKVKEEPCSVFPLYLWLLSKC